MTGPTDTPSGPLPSTSVATTSSPVAPWSRSPTAVLEELDSNAELGLDKAAVDRRRSMFGPNELASAPPVPWWRRLIEQFADPLVILLIIAVVISLVAWLLEGAEGTPYEALVIGVIIVANAVIGLWQEAKAEAAVAALARMAAPHARVLRGGAVVEIATNAVVPGDVLVLAEGDAVCADARLLEAETLKVAEAALTGESEAVIKHTVPIDGPTVVGDRLNMVFSGTAVAAGRGRAVVTSTGMATEIGRIATMIESAVDEPTPLEREIEAVGRMLGIVVVVVALVVIAAILLTSDIDSGQSLVDVLLVGVSLAVAAVPEGLPAILAVVLALGVQRMAAKNAIVKKLSSVETLGSASVICSDKTGTLTKNEMTIERLATASGQVEVTGVGYRPVGEVRWQGAPLQPGALWDEVQLVVGGGSLANDAATGEIDGEWSITGDPTEAAFLVAEAKLGLTDRRRERFQRIHELPFSSERKLMTTVDADAENREHPLVVTKGAPDVLLDRCTHEWHHGQAVPLTEQRRSEIHGSIDEMADDALRTLAVAFRRLDGADEVRSISLENDLVYIGTAGIIDPPRPEAKAAIVAANDAGIRVIMITGDHPITAGRIAEQLGITDAPASVLTGTQVDALTDEAFRSAVRETSVFARVAPEHKLRIVKALQDDDNVVAMTGDGVNDAPALKSADIGVAMGVTGTEVSKEAAKMILTDDNFATILAAVAEGRAIFESIRKFLRYLLSSNMGEVMTMFFGVLLAAQLGLDQTGEVIAAPLLAVQILWINLLTDTAPALALGVDAPIDDVMSRPPRKPTDRVIDREMQWGILLTGLVMGLATLVALDSTLVGGFIASGGDIVTARTVAFTTLVFAQLFNCFSSRSARQSALLDLFGNRLLWAAVALSVVLQWLVVHLPVLNTAFGTTGLTLRQWLLCVGLGSTVLVVDELKKLVLRRSGQSSSSR